jgi:hypothetical protein
MILKRLSDMLIWGQDIRLRQLNYYAKNKAAKKLLYLNSIYPNLRAMLVGASGLDSNIAVDVLWVALSALKASRAFRDSAIALSASAILLSKATSDGTGTPHL